MGAAVWVRPYDGTHLVLLMAAAGATDLLDGLVGRRLHGSRQGTANVGAWLDPVCDKVFVVSIASAVFVAFQAPPVVIVLLLARNVALAVMTAVFRMAAGKDRFRRHDFRASIAGKATTVAQFATVLAVVFAPTWSLASAVVTALIGTVAMVERVGQALRPVSGTRS